MAYKVVIEAPLGKARVGVVRGDDGWLMFPGLVGDEGGVVLEDFLPHGERGRRPDGRCRPCRLQGVARVVVIDDRGDEYEATLGDEAWVAVAGEAGSREPLARCEDAAGALVPRPIPDGPRTCVPDVDAVCPICAASAWVEVDEGVYCERCGLQVGADMAIHRFDPVRLRGPRRRGRG